MEKEPILPPVSEQTVDRLVTSLEAEGSGINYDFIAEKQLYEIEINQHYLVNRLKSEELKNRYGEEAYDCLKIGAMLTYSYLKEEYFFMPVLDADIVEITKRNMLFRNATLVTEESMLSNSVVADFITEQPSVYSAILRYMDDVDLDEPERLAVIDGATLVYVALETQLKHDREVGITKEFGFLQIEPEIIQAAWERMSNPRGNDRDWGDFPEVVHEHQPDLHAVIVRATEVFYAEDQDLRTNFYSEAMYTLYLLWASLVSKSELSITDYFNIEPHTGLPLFRIDTVKKFQRETHEGFIDIGNQEIDVFLKEQAVLMNQLNRGETREERAAKVKGAVLAYTCIIREVDRVNESIQ